jgi:probable HAF family extracellular repeat protein
LEALEDRCLMTSYAITTLDTNMGRQGAAFGVNDFGSSVGHSMTMGFRLFRATRWNSAGVKTDLGVLGNHKQSTAEAINNVGNMTGFSNYTPNPFGNYHAFFHNGTTMSDLGTIGGAGIDSYGKGINSSNTIVGYSNYPGGPTNRYHAFTWTSGGGMVDAHPTGPAWGGDNSQAQEINNAGQIVGFSNTAAVPTHTRAYRLSGGVYTQLPLLADWGLGGPQGSEAYGINTEGDVVGGSYVQGGAFGAKAFRGFLWDSATGNLTDLGDLGLGGKHSKAYAINDSGVIVGEANTTPGDSPRHAFVWFAGQGMQDLNSLIPGGTGWILDFAYDINNSGQIVGAGRLNGRPRGFLLTPVPSPIPAPGRQIDAPSAAGLTLQVGDASPLVMQSVISTEHADRALTRVEDAAADDISSSQPTYTPRVYLVAATGVDTAPLLVTSLLPSADPLA